MFIYFLIFSVCVFCGKQFLKFMTLRIIAGNLKGRKLRSVRSARLRPTADRIREAIFNILAFHVRGTRVLDLFAGTGALGVEALSRGAESAVFVDIDKNSIQVLRKNIRSIDLESRTKIIQCQCF